MPLSALSLAISLGWGQQCTPATGNETDLDNGQPQAQVEEDDGQSALPERTRYPDETDPPPPSPALGPPPAQHGVPFFPLNMLASALSSSFSSSSSDSSLPPSPMPPPPAPQVKQGIDERPNARLAVMLPRAQWKEDNEAEVCEDGMCRAKFSLLERRHHCRRCGGVFCGTCTSHTTPLLDTSKMPWTFPPRGFAIPTVSTPELPVLESRVCTECWAQVWGRTEHMGVGRRNSALLGRDGVAVSLNGSGSESDYGAPLEKVVSRESSSSYGSFSSSLASLSSFLGRPIRPPPARTLTGPPTTSPRRRARRPPSTIVASTRRAPLTLAMPIPPRTELVGQRLYYDSPPRTASAPCEPSAEYLEARRRRKEAEADAQELPPAARSVVVQHGEFVYRRYFHIPPATF